MKKIALIIVFAFVLLSFDFSQPLQTANNDGANLLQYTPKNAGSGFKQSDSLPRLDSVKISPEFMNSSYWLVYQKLLHNKTYRDILSIFSGSNNFSYTLFFGDSGVTRKSKASTRCRCIPEEATRAEGLDTGKVISLLSKSMLIETPIRGPRANRNYYRNEIAMAGTLIHEALHARQFIDRLALDDPNHSEFIRLARTQYIQALQEYRKTNNLEYTYEQMEMLSWEGSTDSDLFKKYLNRIVPNEKIFDFQKAFYELQLDDVILGDEVEAVKEKSKRNKKKSTKIK